ncbi:MAG: NADH/ubiquinone/plastoquinone (complex I) [Coriobacteriia bacterium]|nr:NADH/ubiquinone/plastoquinone (complex I) [Coriobacteriia bacterium]
MSGAALALVGLVAFPLACAAAFVPAGLRRAARIVSPLPAAAALAAAVALPAVPVTRLPWALAGAAVWLDGTGRVFLGLTGAVWLAAVLYALARKDLGGPATWAAAMLSMAGNVAAAVAADPITFYAGFALMALPGYALVLAGREGARAAPDASDPPHAARVYIAYTVLGEALVLAAVALTAAAAPGASFAELPAALAASPFAPAVALFALAGFGVKAGTPPLGGWMPLAYAAAPASAAAALAGATSKAGILGLLRFATPAAAGPSAGMLVATGLLAAYFGAAVGVMQRETRHVLAYSSISQLGLVTVAVGVAAYSGGAVLAVGAVALYALHHALSKAALFLGEDLSRSLHGRPRTSSLAALALPAAALAGLPLTGGALSKAALKSGAQALPEAWHDPVVTLLTLAAAGTTLLMARFLWLAAARPPEAGGAPQSGAIAAWVALLAGVAAAPWLLPGEAARYAVAHALDAEYLLPAVWAPALGLALAAAAFSARGALARFEGSIPAGDLLALFEPAAARLAALLRRPGEAAPPETVPARPAPLARVLRPLAIAEDRATAWNVAGTVFLALAAAFALLAVLGAGR